MLYYYETNPKELYLTDLKLKHLNWNYLEFPDLKLIIIYMNVWKSGQIRNLDGDQSQLVWILTLYYSILWRKWKRRSGKWQNVDKQIEVIIDNKKCRTIKNTTFKWLWIIYSLLSSGTRCFYILWEAINVNWAWWRVI